jgi:hypothetical protein
MKIASRIFPLVLLAFFLAASGCRKGPAVTANEVVAIPSQSVPTKPDDAAWDAAQEYVAKLLPQDLVEPRLMKPSTAEVRVRAIANRSEIGFRLQWTDPQQNDTPGPGHFLDACAVQIPKTVAPQPPAPQMGEAGKPVEITYWRSDWQATLNGRGDTIQDIYPNATVDHYPFTAHSLENGSPEQKEMATLYAPAQGAGNRRVGPREVPVEDLVAEGPGTLSPAPVKSSKGAGARTRDGWSVVITRRLPEGLAPHVRTQVAFAVWEGSAQEAGARKMRTGWIPLLRQEAK